MNQMVKKRTHCSFCGEKISQRKEGDILRDYCASCDTFFYKNPLPVVSSIVVVDRELLLVKRKYEPHIGEWCLPSGFAETGESIQGAALRELEEETGIKGIGKEIAGSLVAYFEDESNKRLIGRLLEAGIQFETPQRSSAGSAIGEKSFVITGTLESMKRSEAKELILSKGGRVASSVSKRTDFLVAGDSAGSKLEKARDLGITILDEEGFKKLLEE